MGMQGKPEVLQAPDAVQRAEELWSHTERMRPSTGAEEVAEVA